MTCFFCKKEYLNFFTNITLDIESKKRYYQLCSYKCCDLFLGNMIEKEEENSYYEGPGNLKNQIEKNIMIIKSMKENYRKLVQKEENYSNFSDCPNCGKTIKMPFAIEINLENEKQNFCNNFCIVVYLQKKIKFEFEEKKLYFQTLLDNFLDSL